MWIKLSNMYGNSQMCTCAGISARQVLACAGLFAGIGKVLIASEKRAEREGIFREKDQEFSHWGY